MISSCLCKSVCCSAQILTTRSFALNKASSEGVLDTKTLLMNKRLTPVGVRCNTKFKWEAVIQQPFTLE